VKRLVLVTALAALPLVAEDLPRNPFWPLGYEGVRRPISALPRFPTVQKPLPGTPEAKKEAERAAKAETVKKEKAKSAAKAKAEAERKAKEAAEKAENDLWDAAGKSMRFGGTMNLVSANGAPCRVFTINGRPYSAGDLISVNSGSFRFTWKLKELAGDGKLRLERVKRRPLDESKQ